MSNAMRSVPQAPGPRQALLVLLFGLVAIALRSARGGPRAASGPAQSPPDPATWPHRPRVSVLVAAWNEAALVGELIESFLALRYPERELIVCAGGDDGTLAIAATYAGPTVRVIAQQRGEGKQRALQRSLKLASGEVLMLTDADCVLDEQALLRLIEPLARGEARAVTGVSLPRHDQWCHPLVQYQGLSDLAWQQGLPTTASGLLGRNCALERGLVEDLDAFSVPARTGTDYVLGRLVAAAGVPVRWVVESRIATEYPETPGAYLAMWRRWNKNLLIHGVRYEAWSDVRGIAVACAVYGATAALPALAPIVGPLGPVGGALLFAQALANRLERLRRGGRVRGEPPSWRTLVGLPLYTVLDMLAVFLAVFDMLDPRRRGRW